MRYVIALVAALVAGVYVDFRNAPEESVIQVAAAAFGIIISGFLLRDISRLKPDQLGELRHEQGTLNGALGFFILYSIFSLVFTVQKYATPRDTASNATPGDRASNAASAVGDWVYHTWAEDKDCAPAIRIAKGSNPSEMTLETIDSDGRHTRPSSRKIIGEPTADTVVTAEGTFRLQPDGTLIMSDQTMENARLHRCD